MKCERERERASVALSAEQEKHTKCVSRCLNTRKRNLFHMLLRVYAWTQASQSIVSKSMRKQTLCEHNRTPITLYRIIILVTILVAIASAITYDNI